MAAQAIVSKVMGEEDYFSEDEASSSSIAGLRHLCHTDKVVLEDLTDKIASEDKERLLHRKTTEV